MKSRALLIGAALALAACDAPTRTVDPQHLPVAPPELGKFPEACDVAGPPSDVGTADQGWAAIYNFSCTGGVLDVKSSETGEMTGHEVLLRRGLNMATPGSDFACVYLLGDKANERCFAGPGYSPHNGPVKIPIYVYSPPPLPSTALKRTRELIQSKLNGRPRLQIRTRADAIGVRG